MKIEREQDFYPIVVTFETEVEVLALLECIANQSCSAVLTFCRKHRLPDNVADEVMDMLYSMYTELKNRLK
jgi:hypothetical protein